MARWHLLHIALLAAAPPCSLSGAITSLVDPLIATRGGSGFGGWGNAQLSPAAIAPFPFLRLGPDTTRIDPVLGEVWSKLNRHAGYFGSDNAVRAFSHTRLQGAGDADLGNFGLMVVRDFSAALIEKQPLPVGPVTLGRSPFVSRFDAGDVAAAPGYVGVSLTDAVTWAEAVAAGTHSGQSRWSCGLPGGAAPSPPVPGNGSCTLVLDVCHSNYDGPGCPYGNVSLTPGSALDPALGGGPSWTLTATVRNAGEFVSAGGGFLIHLHAVITASVTMGNGTAQPIPAPLLSSGLWAGRVLLPPGVTNSTASSDSLGAYLTFPPPASITTPMVITVRVGLSTVDPAHALGNLLAEQCGGNTTGPCASFEEARSGVDGQWEALLSAVAITPATAPDAGAEAARGAVAAEEETLRRYLPALAEGAVEEGARAAREAVAAFLGRPEGAGWAAEQGMGNASVDDVLSSLTAAAQASRAAAAATRASLGSGSDLTIFYTNLFRVYSAPSTYSEWDGSYPPFQGAGSSSGGGGGGGGGGPAPSVPPGRRFFSDLSLWDIYRSHAPWLDLALPAAAADLAVSLVSMAQQGGRLPMWPLGPIDSLNMVGTHAAVVLADCFARGACVDGVNANLQAAATAAMAAVSSQDEAGGAASYATLGWVPFTPGNNASNATRGSWTLEYAIDDAAAASLAKRAGNASAAAVFQTRAGSYRAAWCSVAQTMCPRLANGSFIIPPSTTLPHPFDPYYTEGDALQWQWAVPHDQSGLLSLYTSPDAFVEALTSLMVNQTAWPLGTFLPNPWYWAGNEPDILAPWQFVAAGPQHAWRTAYWTRWVLRNAYGTGPDGLPGNDDYGTLAAWGVWAALGIYPIAASDPPTYVLGSPLFADVTISVPSGWRVGGAGGGGPLLRILAHNATAGAIFVASAAVNGVPLPSPVVPHETLFPAGVPGPALLEVWMTDTPGPWGGGA